MGQPYRLGVPVTPGRYCDRATGGGWEATMVKTVHRLDPG